MNLKLFVDFLKLIFTFKILKGRSCRPVSRRGKSFATLETLIALRQIWSWWAWWTGGAPFIFDVFVFDVFVFAFAVFAVFTVFVFVFSFLRWYQKWHAWNGALPTKTSLQSGLDPLIFFTPIYQVSVVEVYNRLYQPSGRWTFLSQAGSLVFYTLKNPGWPEMNLALPSSPFCPQEWSYCQESLVKGAMKLHFSVTVIIVLNVFRSWYLNRWFCKFGCVSVIQ